MPIDIGLYTQFKGLAVAPEDIRAGEAESKALPVVSDEGQLLQSVFKRHSLTITVRGIRSDQAESFLQTAQQANLNLFQGSPQKEDIALLGRTYYQCVLVDAQITQPIRLNQSSDLVEQLTLVYESQVFV